MSAPTRSTRKSGPPFTVMFGLSEPEVSAIRPFHVFIVPSEHQTKDYGFRTRVDVHVGLPGNLPYFGFSAFFGLLTPEADTVSDVLRIEEELRDTDNPAKLIEANESHRFFTMLPSMDDYRRLVRVIGAELTSDLLLDINDVVALGEFQPSSDIPQLAAGTQVFQRSFIRHSESFFAFRNAGPILRGINSEEFGRMSNDIEVTFRLAGRVNEHRLRFRFDYEGDLPKRIAVVIGKNGVGKSWALGQIVRAALAGDEVSLRETNTRERVSVNRVLAFAPASEWASVFPPERKKSPKVWYKRFALNRTGRARRGGGVADMVLQVARSEGFIGKLSRWEIFLDAIRAISDWEQIVLVNSDRDSAPIPIAALRPNAERASLPEDDDREDESELRMFSAIDLNREPVRLVDDAIYSLSSGETSFLRFAAQASLYVENGSLLLLDEPETHLHPNFISRFVALLNELLVNTGSAAVISTHSAYFVREVFREQVTVLSTTSDGMVISEPLRLQTFGADVGSISYFVFGEDEPSRLAAEVERSLLTQYQSWDKLYADYKDDLSPEMLGSLRLALEAKRRDE
ncbi:AAA family ATPase [Paraburkholderia tagetis]|uniref:AAA family ATPase n=1 Tax=Paraburkholderia tagetis TaxID=2913261 RepID=A0A9X2A2S2_9BURK|nr:AAA family ATPase [Paraburkholderia tagetis]MCG5078681.1 AAA family ATPase [Paraburkholderia tagetis]